ncbi:hypothetical protein WG922_09235 [Ramlibacter sp. AN1015]|uniref:hypothetical protein n=1 Tax=Ramlibacter sp. AN1015 TaxID=3133428 RepID=UPI0030BAEA4A
MHPRTHSMALSLACLAMATGLLAGCGQNDAPDDAPATAPEIVRIRQAPQALEGAHVSMLDPATLQGAEIRKVIGARAHCSFRYTSSGRPVMVVGLGSDGLAELGVVKLNGVLVPLQPAPATAIAPAAFALAAEPVHLTVRPDADPSAIPQTDGSRVAAEMIFEVGQQLRAGYHGYLECRPAAPAPAAQR